MTQRQRQLDFRPSILLMQQLSVLLISIASVTIHTSADQTYDDYTCDVQKDASGTSGCTSQGNGVCDDPKLGGSIEECRNYDCIDCNRKCGHFNADCYGCLSATGCYYCPGDGTCLNSNLYSPLSMITACSSLSDFLVDDLASCTPDSARTDDPLYQANAWMYEMINVVDVWETYGLRGEGIKIRINDEGVDIKNLEFSGRFDLDNSCEKYLPENDNMDHGTIVAGIVLGNADNDLCAAGIAHNATFSSCNIFPDMYPAKFLDGGVEGVEFDISQNSLGIPACTEKKGSTSQEDIIYEQGCPFTYLNQYTNDELNPCSVCQDEFTVTDRIFSDACESVITSHCKDYYKYDRDACLDFPHFLVEEYLDCNYDLIPDDHITALQSGIENGRNGKGVIYVFASGNMFEKGDDVNFSRWTNSRFTITVGAVDKRGFHADFSSPGAALVVSAPSGGADDIGHLMTASTGVNSCTDSSYGTSFSCPVVSGVVALILQANPDLSWRDVQGILAQTSKSVPDDGEDDTQTVNGAGLWHSNWYGFGIVDAKAAVEAAMNWDLYTEELMAIGNSQDGNETILSDSIGNDFVSTIQLDPTSDNYPNGFIAESTVVLLDINHYNRGDLEIELVSPSQTTSILHPGKLPEDNLPGHNEKVLETRWKLMTVRNWGESPTGSWKLKIRDLIDREGNNDNNVFRGWKIIVYGREGPGNSGPVVAPIVTPTSKPTLEPTKIPTDEPTAKPTDEPTSKPTLEPTKIPTGEPSSKPTFEPTKEPTGEPTNKPTLEPTKEPTDEPTAKPTDEPTSKPTLEPTDKPIEKPTAKPIDDPTRQPTKAPSDKPIEDPTGQPTKAPSDKPIDNPTGQPTKAPSDKPIDEPTGQPTKVPSDKPIDEPTKEPTTEPTKESTKEPIDTPLTSAPTRVPTAEPNPEPISAPTVTTTPEPTRNPTPEPTSEPTTKPTKEPTNKPTLKPTKKPTDEPTNKPTLEPTKKPTDEPTKNPTSKPTDPVDIAATNSLSDSGNNENDQNISCESALSIQNLTVIEGKIHSMPLVELDGRCLSGLETVGGWYQVVGNGKVFSLTACTVDISKNVGISVFTGECTELKCIEHQSRQLANCESGNGQTISFASKSSKLYTIFVSGLPVGAAVVNSNDVPDGTSVDFLSVRRRLEPEFDIDYRLEFTEEEAPKNSKCGSAIPVTFEAPIDGSTAGLQTRYKTCQNTEKSGAWYTVAGGEPTEDGVIVYEANTCNSNSNFYNTMSVFRGNNCGSHDCVNVDILPCPNGWFGQQIYWSTAKQEDYQVFVHSSDSIEALQYDAGSFQMNLAYNKPLSNDQCTTAMEIELNEEGTLKGTTSGARPDIDSINSSSCQTGGAGAWHRVTGTGAIFQVSTCSIETDHSTRIQVYSGECGKLTCVDSGTENKALCDETKASVVNFNTQEGVEYYILVSSRDGGSGNFGLKVTKTQPPENNVCKTAFSLGEEPLSGSTLHATIDFPLDYYCGLPLNSPGVWYEIEGKGEGIEINICDSDFDSAISIFKGSSCGNLKCITGTSAINRKCTAGQGVTASFFGEKSTNYRVYIHGKSGSPTSTGNFIVSQSGFNVLDANEFCPSARQIPTDGSRIQVSTEDATHASIPSSSCGVAITNPGLWYTFQGTGKPFRISACTEDEGDVDVSLSLFTGGGCDSLKCLTGTTFFETVCSATQGRRALQSSSTLRFMTEKNQDYYVYVHGSNGVGDFDLFVAQEIPSDFVTDSSPVEASLKHGKDLHRWIPVNFDTLVIHTDYVSLDIVDPPLGNATVVGYTIHYIPLSNYTGDDTMRVNGCNDLDCYRFDVTITMMGTKPSSNLFSNTADSGGKRPQLLWLLLLLLLLIPCGWLCLRRVCPVNRGEKKKKNKINQSDSDLFGDDVDSGQDEEGLYYHNRREERDTESASIHVDFSDSSSGSSSSDSSSYDSSSTDNSSYDVQIL